MNNDFLRKAVRWCNGLIIASGLLIAGGVMILTRSQVVAFGTIILGIVSLVSAAILRFELIQYDKKMMK